MNEQKWKPKAVLQHRQGDNVMGMTEHSVAEPAAAVERGKTKLARILAHFAAGGSLNRFEAERLGDHTLNSTIACLSGSYALRFARERESVPNRFGSSTPVVRYRLLRTELQRARRLLKLMTTRKPGQKLAGV